MSAYVDRRVPQDGSTSRRATMLIRLTAEAFPNHGQGQPPPGDHDQPASRVAGVIDLAALQHLFGPTRLAAMAAQLVEMALNPPQAAQPEQKIIVPQFAAPRG